ncbi:heavy-metal-associated domain-containing protein [Burkholderia sp. WSM2230]|uniref:heavy-metal-associated domain-containing protein n=1 Tax=Burkholderia sp. WSM2230 TaxID=944435 RepID=UPI000427CC7E|nr:cation transporter [Burkholderia sp. WSM2230]
MKAEFHVEGMSCQHCVAAVTNAIREHDETAQVQVDLEAGRVAVESTQSIDALKAAIDDAGYTVKAVLPAAWGGVSDRTGGASGGTSR